MLQLSQVCLHLHTTTRHPDIIRVLNLRLQHKVRPHAPITNKQLGWVHSFLNPQQAIVFVSPEDLLPLGFIPRQM